MVTTKTVKAVVFAVLDADRNYGTMLPNQSYVDCFLAVQREFPEGLYSRAKHRAYLSQYRRERGIAR